MQLTCKHWGLLKSQFAELLNLVTFVSYLFFYYWDSKWRAKHNSVTLYIIWREIPCRMSWNKPECNIFRCPLGTRQNGLQEATLPPGIPSDAPRPWPNAQSGQRPDSRGKGGASQWARIHLVCWSSESDQALWPKNLRTQKHNSDITSCCGVTTEEPFCPLHWLYFH